MHHVQFFYTTVCRENCIESTGKSENVIFETVAEVYPFKLMHECISSLWATVKVHKCV